MFVDKAPRLYRPKAACQALGVGMTKLYSLIAAGALDARKNGSCTVITGESVHRYADSLPKANIRTGQRGVGAASPMKHVPVDPLHHSN
jgi:hypothetical protein